MESYTGHSDNLKKEAESVDHAKEAVPHSSWLRLLTMLLREALTFWRFLQNLSAKIR